MTDANDDIRSEDADSGRSKQEKRSADVISASGDPDDPDVYLVEYPDSSTEYEPATPTNVALFEDGLYDMIDGYTVESVGGTEVALQADVMDRFYAITVDDMTVEVPSDMVGDVVRVFKTGSIGQNLLDLYDEILEGQVRRRVIEGFLDRFPSDRVEVTESGWVLDDSFLVTYEAENYLADDRTVYVRQGGDMVEADESKPAVDLNFSVSEERDLTAPDGSTTTITTLEQEFLATVEALLFPENYLGAELLNDVEQAKEVAEVDDIEEITSTAHVSAFTDSKTGNHHSHGFDKHRAIREAAAGDLDNTLDMTGQAIDKLYFNEYDHAAPHELLARREEFENAPFEIFGGDVENDDYSHWKAIERAAGSAPINDEHHRQIQSMFSDDQTSLHEF